MTPRPELERIAAANGWIKRRVCGALGITRPTLDLWIAKYGLDWPGRIDSLDRVVSKVAESVKHTKKHSKASRGADVTSRAVVPTFTSMEATATEKDPRNPASVRVRESVWMRMRMAALRRKTSAAALAEEAFEKFLKDLGEEPAREGEGESR